MTAPVPGASPRRRAIGVAAVVLALAAAVWALYGQRDELGESLRQIGAVPLALSLAVGVAGVGVTFLTWRRVLEGLEVDLPLGPGARVFFVSQLGKYVPGSVWPVVMQMEAGRTHGAGRRTMLTANLFTLALGCTVGLLIAAGLLPFAAPGALEQYWWTLLALPLLLALLWPTVLPAIMNRAFVLLGRDPVDAALPLGNTARASTWSLVSFVLLGLHLALLAAPLAPEDAGIVPLSVGLLALAICAGVIAIPVPAGAGVRDAVLALGLATQLDVADAIVVAVASRALLVLADVLLAVAVLPLNGAGPGLPGPSSSLNDRSDQEE